MNIHITEYFFAPGSPFPQALAAKVGPELDQIKKELGQGAQPADVLAWARAHPKSAIAQCFDWDKDAAAEAHWLRTAGDICRAIRVRLVIEPRDNKPARVIETRYLYHVLPTEPVPSDRAQKVYLPADVVLNDMHYTNQVLERKLSELDRWTADAANFKELTIFVNKIREANREFGRKTPKP